MSTTFFDFDELEEVYEKLHGSEGELDDSDDVAQDRSSVNDALGPEDIIIADSEVTPTAESFEEHMDLLAGSRGHPQDNTTREIIVNGGLSRRRTQPRQSPNGSMDYAGLNNLADAKEAPAALDGEDNLESGSTASSDDGLSEIWPGDTPYLEEVDDTTSEEHSTDVSQEADTQLRVGTAEADNESVSAWEVVYSRIVVRSAPSFDAPPLGFASRRELFFAEPEEASDEHWVKLSKERGYILKDGRHRDPKLSLLLQPFHIDLDVPAHHQQEVLRLMRDTWVKFRIASKSYLKPLLIERLRNTCEDAITKACGDALDAFDVGAFKDELGGKVDAMLEPLLENGNNGAGHLQNQVSQARSPATPADGDAKAWRHDQFRVLNADQEVSASYALQLLESMKQRNLPSAEDALEIVTKATNLFAAQPSLVELSVPYGATMHVVGDLHGQYWDLLKIMELYGSPSKNNWFLFNGDFVDRGQFSVEVVLALFALKAAFPLNVHLNRGNHEAARMNVHYGFMNEAKLKYSNDVFIRFVQAFKTLPLAHVVNKSVFVVHGGLPRQDGVRLEDIKLLDRKREPDDNAQDLMIDLLWSDPMESPGRGRSPRGAGTLFGPDVTQQFCQENDLTCVIRSHEMKDEGFEWHHDKMCLTIFSAANYCDICGNFGAVCDLIPQLNGSTIAREDISVNKFEASAHPNERNAQLQSVFTLVQ